MASEYISVEALIAEASSTIKNFTQQEAQLARQWSYTALRKIGLGRRDLKTSDRLYLSDWSTAKPSDMASLEDLALFDSAGKEIVVKYKGRANINTSAWATSTAYVIDNMVVEDGVRYICLEAHTSGTFSTDLAAEKWSAISRDARIHEDIRGWIGAIQISEDDNYFNVEEFSDDTPSKVYLVIRYYAYPVDGSGDMKIPETHTLAIIMYIRYMWSLRERTSLGEQQVAREVWLREAAAAYSRMKTPSARELKETAQTENSMIQKPVIRHRQY